MDAGGAADPGDDGADIMLVLSMVGYVSGVRLSLCLLLFPVLCLFFQGAWVVRLLHSFHPGTLGRTGIPACVPFEGLRRLPQYFSLDVSAWGTSGNVK